MDIVDYLETLEMKQPSNSKEHLAHDGGMVDAFSGLLMVKRPKGQLWMATRGRSGFTSSKKCFSPLGELEPTLLSMGRCDP